MRTVSSANNFVLKLDTRGNGVRWYGHAVRWYGYGVRWYGHALRRPEKDVLMKKMVGLHEANGKRKRGRPKMKWKEKVEGNMRRVILRKDQVGPCRS